MVRCGPATVAPAAPAPRPSLLSQFITCSSGQWPCLCSIQFQIQEEEGGGCATKAEGQPPPHFGEEIPTIRQDNSAGLFFGELLPSHQDYDPGPPNTLSLWLLCCQRHVETLVS